MQKATRKPTVPRQSTQVRPPNSRAAMELAALHLTCLNLEYRATVIYASAPSKHAKISQILQEAAVRLRDFNFRLEVGCDSGFKDCNGECIPVGDPPCKPPPEDLTNPNE